MVPRRILADILRSPKYPIELAAVAVVYFAAAKLSLTLASIHPNATPIWPPTGLALAAILLCGHRIWPAIFAGAFLVNLTTAGSIYTSCAIGFGNTLEAVIGGWLINRWSDGRNTFETPIGVAKFTLIGLGPSTMTSATIGVGSLSLAGYADLTGLCRSFLLDVRTMQFWACTGALADAVAAGTLAFTRELWRRCGGYPDASIGEDLALLAELARRGRHGVRLHRSIETSCCAPQ